MAARSNLGAVDHGMVVGQLEAAHQGASEGRGIDGPSRRRPARSTAACRRLSWGLLASCFALAGAQDDDWVCVDDASFTIEGVRAGSNCAEIVAHSDLATFSCQEMETAGRWSADQAAAIYIGCPGLCSAPCPPPPVWSCGLEDLSGTEFCLAAIAAAAAADPPHDACEIYFGPHALSAVAIRVWGVAQQGRCNLACGLNGFDAISSEHLNECAISASDGSMQCASCGDDPTFRDTSGYPCGDWFSPTGRRPANSHLLWQLAILKGQSRGHRVGQSRCNLPY